MLVLVGSEYEDAVRIHKSGTKWSLDEGTLHAHCYVRKEIRFGGAVVGIQETEIVDASLIPIRRIFNRA